MSRLVAFPRNDKQAMAMSHALQSPPQTAESELKKRNPSARTISASELAAHASASSLWVAVKGKVYDITHFIFDHPGGEEILLQYGGKDVSQTMIDPAEHVHSDAAFDMLEPFFIGVLDGAQSSVMPSQAASDFIDIERPMLAQVWRSRWSKAHYLRMVHIPRHTHDSPRIFASPLLEPFSRTPWWFIPVFWTPIISYCLFEASSAGGFTALPAVYLAGIFVWTLIEYTLHRFVFHMEELLPEHPAAFTIHFLFHGIHHYLPMDRLRLVMPPALGFTLAYPIWSLYLIVLPRHIGQALAAGSMTGFVLYDLIHFYLHHGKPYTQHLREMKTYHLDHHYKNANLGFGVSSKFWDIIFGTLL